MVAESGGGCRAKNTAALVLVSGPEAADYGAMYYLCCDGIRSAGKLRKPKGLMVLRRSDESITDGPTTDANVTCGCNSLTI